MNRLISPNYFSLLSVYTGTINKMSKYKMTVPHVQLKYQHFFHVFIHFISILKHTGERTLTGFD